jgi:hypothetical protein
MLESVMANDCYEYFSKNLPNTVIVREVPFLSRCIDLVLVAKGTETVTIEFKIKNWRRAIEQARDHLLGSDAAYVCLPQRVVSDTLTCALNDAGIGLMLYSSEAEEKVSKCISAPENHRKVAVFHEKLLQTVDAVYSEETGKKEHRITKQRKRVEREES